MVCRARTSFLFGQCYWESHNDQLHTTARLLLSSVTSTQSSNYNVQLKASCVQLFYGSGQSLLQVHSVRRCSPDEIISINSSTEMQCIHPFYFNFSSSKQDLKIKLLAMILLWKQIRKSNWDGSRGNQISECKERQGKSQAKEGDKLKEVLKRISHRLNSGYWHNPHSCLLSLVQRSHGRGTSVQHLEFLMTFLVTNIQPSPSIVQCGCPCSITLSWIKAHVT